MSASVDVLCLMAAIVACTQQGAVGGQQRGAMPEKSIEAVLKEHTASLMSLSGVVGTAQGECSGQPCILVLVSIQTQELKEQVPSAIEGYPVSIQETGEFRKFNSR